MFLEFVRNISFIDVVFAFEDLKMPVTLCFEKISAPRCFMSKVCQFGELVHLCKNINTDFLQNYYQHGQLVTDHWLFVNVKEVGNHSCDIRSHRYIVWFDIHKT